MLIVVGCAYVGLIPERTAACLWYWLNRILNHVAHHALIDLPHSHPPTRPPSSHSLTRLVPIAYEFSPDLIIVSAGFDAAEGDPLGGCHLSPACYGHLTALLQPIAPLVLLLEGGYNLAVTAASVEACVRVMLGEPPARLKGLQPPTPVGLAGISRAQAAHSRWVGWCMGVGVMGVGVWGFGAWGGGVWGLVYGGGTGVMCIHHRAPFSHAAGVSVVNCQLASRLLAELVAAHACVLAPVFLRPPCCNLFAVHTCLLPCVVCAQVLALPPDVCPAACHPPPREPGGTPLTRRPHLPMGCHQRPGCVATAPSTLGASSISSRRRGCSGSGGHCHGSGQWGAQSPGDQWGDTCHLWWRRRRWGGLHAAAGTATAAP